MPCKLCKQTGHNSRTCGEKLPLSGLLDSTSPASISLECAEKKVPEEKEKKDEKKDKPNKLDKKYYCYFLGQPDNWCGQTYNGYTVNLQRRLRQHNGEIKGGAYATTKKGPGAWTLIAVMTCETWNNIDAMKCEWNCRYPTRKKPRPRCYAGAKGRISSLVEVFKHITVPVKLYVHPEFYDFASSSLQQDLPHVELVKELFS